MQPVFHSHCIEALGPLMVEETTRMLQRWQAFLPTDPPLNVAAEMNRLAIIIIGKAMFSADLGNEIDAIREAFTTINNVIGRVWQSLFTLQGTIEPSRNQQVQTALATLDRVVYAVIDEHRGQKESRRDLLTVLMGARNRETGEALSDQQLRDEVMTIFLAGHETTANVLGWVWYLLARHPMVESQIHAELDTTLRGRTPTVGDLPDLVYTRMVIQESMRLYPPVWFFTRQALAEDEIGGWRISRDDHICISPYTLHRHATFWEDPEQFDPERFSPERFANRPSHAYLPFADGKHRCIGDNFAMVEAQLVVSTIAQRFRLSLVPGCLVEPEPLMALTHRSGLPMTIAERH